MSIASPQDARPSTRPSILAVTSELPWPLDCGGHLRTYHVLRSLAGRFDVRLVVPWREEDPPGGLDAAGIDARLVRVPRRTVMSESVRAAASALRREPYVLFGRHRWRQVRRAFARAAAERRPDALYLDHLDSLLYGDAAPGIPLIVDMHNVYSRLALRAAHESAAPVRRRYLAMQARQLARMERLAAQRAHTICVVSQEEAQYFAELGARRVAVVPNGVDCTAFDDLPLAERSGPATILFVGSLAWTPNVSAVRFLIADVLPAVRRSIPDARLVVVGRNPSRELTALAGSVEGVALAANVPDVVPYLRTAHVLAVPLQAGGGTRLKILEAFAAGVPVVSTPIGCEGIDATPGDHLIVADRPAFADAVVHLVRNRALCRRLAERARRLVRQRYDWSVVGARACTAVAGVIAADPEPVARASMRVLENAPQGGMV